ncbi:uncharacterized protein TNCV_2474461 [Trichonephila clavipes]|nr:uncharacterized protein TNCV_2474461 [Trichonephila clavipes]
MKDGWSARRVAHRLDHSDCIVRRCWDQWILVMSFTRKPGSTEQSSRRPPHRKKCTRAAKCFIGHHLGTGNTFNRGPCVFSNHTKPPG